jgi:hypothetical protein
VKSASESTSQSIPTGRFLRPSFPCDNMLRWVINMDLIEFDFDKRIDPDALDTECLRQADVYFKWAERAIEARGEADRLKLKLDTLVAELEIDVRKDPRKYKLDKVTDASAKAKVLSSSEYIEAHERYFSARDDAALLDKATAAMEMKKRMIETLVTLHGQSYFAGPSAPRNLKEAWMKQQEAVADRVNKKQLKIVRRRSP